MKWTPTLLASSVVLTVPLSLTTAAQAQSAQVINGPTGPQFTVGSLPDGNYRFCSDRPPSGIDRVSGACFRFRKNNEDIVGEYYYPYEGSSICLTGQVNNNTVTGQGLETLPVGGDRPENLPGENELSDWRQEGFLQVGRSDFQGEGGRDRIRYRSALLNLNNFYQFNAGTVLPPQNCFTAVSTPNPGFDPNPDEGNDVGTVPPNFRQVGTSAAYRMPVYLDEESILQLEDNTYRYRLAVGLNPRESESDIVVDCDTANRVRILRTRYYNNAGEISSIEESDVERAVRPSGANAPKYQANQIVCQGSETGSGELEIPDLADVDFERYYNDRFNYSVLYPANLLTPQDPPTNSDGRAFRSPDSRIVMRVYGRNNSLSETLEERYQRAIRNRTNGDRQNVTYQTQGDDFFIISGYNNNNVFYQKTFLQDGVFKTLRLRYDRTLQPEFDPIVAEISDSFSS